ncbi:L-rhamnose mutarotase [Polaribacter sp. R2A056_3_33]|uniref:L-rhamnose mutarotase n=1 Tax=unclassified Polaribacter TaxID=196858 RepID=UPI001C4EDA6A|nr:MULTISPECIES: L-rhamnose mutarotase [unclassified Polaribacter]QXP63900.1 L-rhamnose mutarotase [Polaribacter sp. HaHaR_3_91]QXP71893.1 L-rhamnose mutarotase [Polaribacter sp. R2A056_3_33]
MTKYCFALDLKDDEKLISEYKKYHQEIWPEITKSIVDAGILNLEIFNVHNRLFMIMEVDASFSFEEKDKLDKNNVKVQEWEVLMWKYQKGLPMAKKGEKWVLMDRIYQL